MKIVRVKFKHGDPIFMPCFTFDVELVSEDADRYYFKWVTDDEDEDNGRLFSRKKERVTSIEALN